MLITDGASNSGKISPVEAAENAREARHQDLHGRDRHHRGPRFRKHPALPAPGVPDLPTLRKIAELTGAEHYWAQNAEQLKDEFPDHRPA